MDRAEITARGNAFVASIRAGRVSLAAVEITVGRWVLSGMASEAECLAILDIVRAAC